MICPKCSSHNIHVIDTVSEDDEYVFRRRKCKACGEKFKTAEKVISEDDPLRYRLSEVEHISRIKREIGGAR